MDVEELKLHETLVERRRHVRVEAALEVSFAIAGEGADSYGRAVTRDISHGGACLAVSDCTKELLGRLAEQPLLDLKIDKVSAKPFQGRVEWVRILAGPGALTLIGLEFHNLSASDEMTIIDLIAHILIGTPAPPLSGISDTGREPADVQRLR